MKKMALLVLAACLAGCSGSQVKPDPGTIGTVTFTRIDRQDESGKNVAEVKWDLDVKNAKILLMPGESKTFDVVEMKK